MIECDRRGQRCLGEETGSGGEVRAFMWVRKEGWKGKSVGISEGQRQVWEFLVFTLLSPHLLCNIFFHLRRHSKVLSSLLIWVKRNFPSWHPLIFVLLLDINSSLLHIFPNKPLVTFFQCKPSVFISAHVLSWQSEILSFFSPVILFQFN